MQKILLPIILILPLCMALYLVVCIMRGYDIKLNNLKIVKMKKIFVIVMLFVGGFMQAQDKNAKATIEVDGVCMMCKFRIEKAALKTKGVKSATWNMENHQLSLIYNEEKTNLETIQQNVANVGHDTKEIKATEEAYNSVNACCKYRDPNVIDSHGKDGSEN